MNRFSRRTSGEKLLIIGSFVAVVGLIILITSYLKLYDIPGSAECSAVGENCDHMLDEWRQNLKYKSLILLSGIFIFTIGAVIDIRASRIKK